MVLAPGPDQAAPATNLDTKSGSLSETKGVIKPGDTGPDTAK